MKKKSKLIAAAVALLGLSTAASVTGTVAWFTAANKVGVNSIYMKAEAEEGIVISAYSSSEKTAASWGDSADAATSGQDAAFIPTSTCDLATWYHGNASNVDSAAPTSLEQISVTEAQGVNTATVAEATKSVFLLNSFYIQSVTSVAIESQYIYMSDFSITNAAQDLSKSLRIGIKELKNHTVTILAPVTGFTANYTVGGTITDGVRSGGTATVASAVPTGINKVWLTGNTAQNIGAYTAAGTNAWEFKVYAWFEGEDANCKSANIAATLEQLTISFKLGNASTKA